MLPTVPPELLMLLLSYLSPSDIARVSLSCRQLRQVTVSDYFWKLMCQRRFNTTTHDQNHVELFKLRYLKSRKLLGNDLGIIWLDQHHWNIRNTSAHLNNVWWFQVDGRFEGVEKGSYIPTLDLEFLNAYGLEAIQCHVFNAELPDSERSTYSFESLNGLEWNNGPMLIKMPPLELGSDSSQRFYNVQVQLTDFDTQRLKRGLIIHSIRLDPVKASIRQGHTRDHTTQTEDASVNACQIL